METRNPVGVILVVNFRRSVIISELWRPEVARRYNFKRHFCVFKTTPYGKISKILLRKLSSKHWSTCCVLMFKFREIWPTENWWNRALLTWQKPPGSTAVAAVLIAPKICQGQPPTMYSECSRFHPNRFTFGGVIAERVNTAKTRHKVNPIFGWSLASSRIINSIVHVFTSKRHLDLY